ncbi:MAG: helix-turn-helix domain-containing protein [Prochloraceae cyanobacterium]
MTAKKKPVLVDCSPENSIDRILPRKAVFSSRKLGWKDLLLEYHRQPSGEYQEVYSPGHGIVIITKIEKQNQIETFFESKIYKSPLRVGDAAIVPANIIHKAGWHGERELISIGFDRQIFATTIEDTAKFDRATLIPQLPVCDPLIAQIGLALKTAIENNANSRLYVETMTNALAVHLLQYYSTERPILKEYKSGLSRRDLKKVVDYIEANLDLDLSLQDLANLVHISPHYFSSLFKQSTGLTPHKYVIKTRIELAKTLLLQRKTTIADIAKTVGFANQSHLNLHFKRQVGVTPKQFARR